LIDNADVLRLGYEDVYHNDIYQGNI